MKNGSDAAVEISIVRVAILDHVHARKKKQALSEALPHKSGDYRNAIQMNSIMRVDQVLIGMPRRRQKRGPVRDVEDMSVECVNVNIFQRRRK